MTSSSLTSVPPALLEFQFLKRMVSIEQVLAHRGWLSSMRQRGNSLVGPCPIHKGDSARSFVVSRNRNLWRCFSRCNAGGDVVELVRRLDSLSYRETAFYLASLLGTAAVHTGPAAASGSPPRPFQPFRHPLALIHTHPFLRDKRILPETARDFDAGFYGRVGFLHNCIGVRLHDPSGIPLGYAGRRLHPREIRLYGKWKLPPRFPKSQILYNLHRARAAQAQSLVVVECSWSVMRLHQIRVTAVALLGTALSQAQRRLLLALAPRRLVLLLDGDLAGRVATANIATTLSDSISVRSTFLPPHSDPDDLTDSALAAILHPSLL